MIRKLNDQLYFHYEGLHTFCFKRETEYRKDYGKQIGTAQLMFLHIMRKPQR